MMISNLPHLPPGRDYDTSSNCCAVDTASFSPSLYARHYCVIGA